MRSAGQGLKISERGSTIQDFQFANYCSNNRLSPGSHSGTENGGKPMRSAGQELKISERKKIKISERASTIQDFQFIH